MKIHMFTSIQLFCLVILWVVKSTSLSLAFPFFLLLMLPLRAQLTRIFTPVELRAVSSSLKAAWDVRKLELEEGKAELDAYSLLTYTPNKMFSCLPNALPNSSVTLINLTLRNLLKENWIHVVDLDHAEIVLRGEAPVEVLVGNLPRTVMRVACRNFRSFQHCEPIRSSRLYANINSTTKVSSSFFVPQWKHDLNFAIILNLSAPK